MKDYTENTPLKDIIPRGFYCYFGSAAPGDTSYHHCPFWRGYHIAAQARPLKETLIPTKRGLLKPNELVVGDCLEKNNNNYPKYDINCIKEYPNYQIGECTPLHVSDLDEGEGLLWDQCKSCGINMGNEDDE